MNRALWLTLFFAACGPELLQPVEQTPAVEQEPQVQTTTIPLTGFPCEVREVLQANCASCHTHQTYAPPFTTRDEVVEPRFAQLLKARIEPSADYPMPPRRSEQQLTEAQRQVLDAWFAAGMPAGECGPLTQ